jgi:predicted metalloprotease with PDZ domain
MGTFALASFRACGVQHDVVFTGKVPQLDLRVCRDLKKICEAQIKLFEPRSAARRCSTATAATCS